MGSMDDLAARLEQAASEMVELELQLAAGEPWPLTDVYEPGPESSWGPREVLAHVGEMIPYWTGEIELIVDAGVTSAKRGATGVAKDPPSFGRLEDDPVRVALIGRDRAFPTRELLSRIDTQARRVAERFRELTDEQAESLGRHVTRGDLTVREIAERLIVSHLEGHVTQLRETLGPVN